MELETTTVPPERTRSTSKLAGQPTYLQYPPSDAFAGREDFAISSLKEPKTTTPAGAAAGRTTSPLRLACHRPHAPTEEGGRRSRVHALVLRVVPKELDDRAKEAKDTCPVCRTQSGARRSLQRLVLCQLVSLIYLSICDPLGIRVSPPPSRRGRRPPKLFKICRPIAKW